MVFQINDPYFNLNLIKLEFIDVNADVLQFLQIKPYARHAELIIGLYAY